MTQNRHLNPYEQTQLARYGQRHDFKGDVTSAPIEYITGNVEFCGLVFQIDERALIPRIETEQLVDLTLKAIREKIARSHHMPLVIADIGTGGGAIAISLAKQLANYKELINLIATDISQEALELAKLNAQRLLANHEPSIKFILSDLLQAVPKRKLDVIVANLPYIPTSYLQALDDSVIKHEPHLALDGGDEGLDWIAHLLDQAPNYLKPDGTLLLEINHTHWLSDFQPWQKRFDLTILPDENGANRYLIANLKS